MCEYLQTSWLFQNMCWVWNEDVRSTLAYRCSTCRDRECNYTPPPDAHSLLIVVPCVHRRQTDVVFSSKQIKAWSSCERRLLRWEAEKQGWLWMCIWFHKATEDLITLSCLLSSVQMCCRSEGASMPPCSPCSTTHWGASVPSECWEHANRAPHPAPITATRPTRSTYSLTVLLPQGVDN